MDGHHGPEAPAPLRVILVDDDALVRQIVRDVLQRAGIVVIAEAGTGREAVELSVYYQPDVVVMDALMPGMDGVAAMREILAARPAAKVLMLSSSADDELAVLCLRLGACGYLTKSLNVESLPRAIRAARDGEAIVPRRLAGRLIEEVRRTPEDGAGLRPVRSPLTAREWEVLDLLCRGMSTDDIADTLVVSPETVRSHVKSVLRKLGVRSRRDAIDAAGRLRSGMFDEVPGLAP